MPYKKYGIAYLKILAFTFVTFFTLKYTRIYLVEEENKLKKTPSSQDDEQLLIEKKTESS